MAIVMRRTDKEYEQLIRAIDWSIASFQKIHELSPGMEIYDVMSHRKENGSYHTDIIARSVVLTRDEHKNWNDAGFIVHRLQYPNPECSALNPIIRQSRYLMRKRSIFHNCLKIQHLPEIVIAAYVFINTDHLNGATGDLNPARIMEMHEEYTLQQSLFNNLETVQDITNYVNWLYESFKKTEHYSVVMERMNYQYVNKRGNLHGYPLTERAYQDALRLL